MEWEDLVMKERIPQEAKGPDSHANVCVCKTHRVPRSTDRCAEEALRSPNMAAFSSQ